MNLAFVLLFIWLLVYSYWHRPDRPNERRIKELEEIIAQYRKKTTIHKGGKDYITYSVTNFAPKAPRRKRNSRDRSET